LANAQELSLSFVLEVYGQASSFLGIAGEDLGDLAPW
jgi:hypothetical protein